MATQRTLAIIKPDAVGRAASSADILGRKFTKPGFHIAAIKSLRLLRKKRLEGFTRCMPRGRFLVSSPTL